MFKVGDKVWCSEYGIGKVTCDMNCDLDPDYHTIYPLVVDFKNGDTDTYTYDGIFSIAKSRTNIDLKKVVRINTRYNKLKSEL
jgi:hypothetical protein